MFRKNTFTKYKHNFNFIFWNFFFCFKVFNNFFNLFFHENLYKLFFHSVIFEQTKKDRKKLYFLWYFFHFCQCLKNVAQVQITIFLFQYLHFLIEIFNYFISIIWLLLLMGLLILFLFIIIDDLYFFTLVFVFCFFEIFLFPLQFFSSWLFLIPNHSLLFLSLILLYFGVTFNRPNQLQIQKTKTFRKQQLQAPGHPEPLLPHKTHIFYFR